MPVKEWFTAIFTCCFAASAKEEDDEDVEKIDGRRGGNFLMGNYVNDAASESSGHETDPYEDFEIYSIVSIGSESESESSASTLERPTFGQLQMLRRSRPKERGRAMGRGLLSPLSKERTFRDRGDGIRERSSSGRRRAPKKDGKDEGLGWLSARTALHRANRIHRRVLAFHPMKIVLREEKINKLNTAVEEALRKHSKHLQKKYMKNVVKHERAAISVRQRRMQRVFKNAK